MKRLLYKQLLAWKAQDNRKPLLLQAALIVMALAMSDMIPGQPLKEMVSRSQANWIQWLLATPVQFVAGRRFYRQGWAELRHWSPGMNTLILLGSSAAYGYSVLAIVVPEIFPAGSAHRYFEASSGIIEP